MNCKPLSLGTFLQNGLTTIGDQQAVWLDQGSNKFLSFLPQSENNTIYVIRFLIPKDTDIHMTISSVFGLDYEIMHKRMAHPSKEMLTKARKHLKDFLELEYPTKEQPCPGCAQGKMTNQSFPPSSRRASQPFELIHSDLKSFPIDSYHKYRYIIIFFDDYTSSIWTVNLYTKDAAITATKHFVALVENRFDTRVVQWMSDAGGEYKSSAFLSFLKEKGIEILQSIPYAHQQNRRAERAIQTITEKSEAM